MNGPRDGHERDPDVREFYRRVLADAATTGIPFLLGGTYALGRYTGIYRKTKDMDIFVRGDDFEPMLEALARAGHRTEVTFPHWLAKVRRQRSYVDVIYRSANGEAAVEDGWFDRSVDEVVLGQKVALVPAEEMIWSKAFVMERDRFDGADLMHLVRARAELLDWERLVGLFGRHYRLLLAHLVMFGFVYPGERHRVPSPVMARLLDELERELDAPPPGLRLCQGTLVSRDQYLVDVEEWDYKDGRLIPIGRLTAEEIEGWSRAPDRH